MAHQQTAKPTKQPKRVRHPYHLKKMYVAWRARLLRHTHTGKRVHNQHTSYPLLALIVLATGAMLVQSTVNAYAGTSDSFSVKVSAVVSGPVPETPATIDSPDAGRIFTATPINVTGTCALHTYVQLFRNDYPSGTALCSATGTYAIQTDLFEGANKLITRSYNYAMQAGPDSDPVIVTYAPPVTPVTPPIQGTDNAAPGTSSPTSPSGTGNGGSTGTEGNKGTTGLGQSPVQPLTLRNDFEFKGYTVGDEASWQVAVLGGTAPYAISVAWGDGTTALYSSKTSDTLTLSHTYANAGPVDGTYKVIVTATDASGRHTTLQIVALVVSPSAATGTSAGGSTDGPAIKLFGIDILQFIGSLWMAYGALCLVLLSFWLGEARELRLIRSKFRMSRL